MRHGGKAAPLNVIYEAVISTCDIDGGAHFTPMGYRVQDDHVLLSPFVPSRTLENLRRDGYAVLNLTDDVSVIAACLTGRNCWRTVATGVVRGWRLAHALAHRELAVVDYNDDPVRPEFVLETRHAETHAAFSGFNRAQAAVLEAAILLTRLDWLDPGKVLCEMRYLRIAVEKTAGPLEERAWQWITEAIQAHERHDITEVLSR